ncbi:esterase [Rheinheimera mesophila]|uniref:Esterase n=1 Tax=Rheinheimera mesophila TaxID=1547515 RepID=A0A3P3QLL2_9GAMM|nr:patatin-like phospholipase family protein [Rheinheimera mesophila]KKL01346.1 esterase [Rheinheimera mesophila]RRJ21233.1 esterase [Rheinheimera mesophila]
MRAKWLPALVLLLCSALCFSAPADHPAPLPCAKVKNRPCIALVLGGGGARGGAHLGVIRQLEQQAIPVDLIVGTSIGAFIGGLYALGHSPDEIQRILEQLEWSTGFRDKVHRDEMPVRRKQQQDDYPIRLGLGLDSSGVKIPKGVLLGQAMAELILEAYGPVLNYSHFDQLPIPFRAVAADLTNRDTVVMSQGSLLQAVQASMSIPGVVRPMELNGRVLVDGGVANNLPVSVAKQLGADRVIAVAIDAPLLNKDQLDSAFAVTDQLTNFLVRQVVEQQIALLGPQDLLISPDVSQIGTLDFAKLPQSVKAGAASAQRQRAALADFSYPEQYPQWLAAHRAEQELSIEVDRIELDNQSLLSDQVLLQRLALKEHQKYDSKKLKEGLRQVYGVDTLERASVQLEKNEQGENTLLKVRAVEKSWGPGYLNFRFTMEDDFRNNRYYQLAGSYTYTNISELGAELHNELALGTDKLISSELYWPVFTPATFLSAQVQRETTILSLEDTQGLSLGDLANRETALTARAGWNISDHARLTSGWTDRNGYFRIPGSGVADLGFSRLGYERQGPLLDLVWDRLDNPVFPSRGFRISANWQWLDDTAFGRTERSRSHSVEVQAARSLSERHILRTRWRFEQYKPGDPEAAVEQFSLGGLLNLSGYPKNYLFGSEIKFGSLVYLYKMSEDRFSVVNSPFYLGLSLERGQVQGNLIQVETLANETDWIWASSLFAGWDSPFGAVYMGYGRAEDDIQGSADRYYLSLGQNF